MINIAPRTFYRGYIFFASFTWLIVEQYNCKGGQSYAEKIKGGFEFDRDRYDTHIGV